MWDKNYLDNHFESLSQRPTRYKVVEDSSILAVCDKN